MIDCSQTQGSVWLLARQGLGLWKMAMMGRGLGRRVRKRFVV